MASRQPNLAVNLRERAKAGEDVSNIAGPFDAEDEQIFPPRHTGIETAKQDAGPTEDGQEAESDGDADLTAVKGKPNPRTSALGHLRLLKRLTHDFVQAEELGFEPSILVPKGKHRKKGRSYFTRDDLARLLWACRGRRWDPKKIWTEIVKKEVVVHVGGWAIRSVVGDDGVARETRIMLRRDHIAARKGMARAIEIGFRTGSREEVIASYTWPKKGRGRRAKLAPHGRRERTPLSRISVPRGRSRRGPRLRRILRHAEAHRADVDPARTTGFLPSTATAASR